MFLNNSQFFLDGRLSGQEAVQSHLIASVRIKVENVIKQIKDYKIFTETLSNRTNKKLIDDMMIIVCALCNLKSKLMNQCVHTCNVSCKIKHDNLQKVVSYSYSAIIVHSSKGSRIQDLYQTITQ